MPRAMRVEYPGAIYHVMERGRDGEDANKLLATRGGCVNLAASVYDHPMPTEADARIVVDRLLREADWDIENKSVVSTEEAAADGRADYLLKNSRTRPLCVVETKRFSIDPYSAKTQTKEYAVSLGAPFIILSNGREHYFWDYENGDARPIIGFPTQADLESRANLRQHRQGDLATSIRAVPMPTRFRFKGEDVEARPYQLRMPQSRR